MRTDLEDKQRTAKTIEKKKSLKRKCHFLFAALFFSQEDDGKRPLNSFFSLKPGIDIVVDGH